MGSFSFLASRRSSSSSTAVRKQEVVSPSILSEPFNKKKDGRVIVHFFCFLLKSFTLGLCRPSLLSASCFKWSVCRGKTGFHTRCHSFSLLIPAYLYFSIIFIFFSTVDPLREADIDANTMCLFRSLSGSRTTLPHQGKTRSRRALTVNILIN